MCFGQKNAPATFSHLMNKVFQGCQYDFALCFLDDVLCYSGKDFNQHLEHLEEIFRRLKVANLKLKLPKCWFGADQLPFLGHITCREGLKPDPKKIEAFVPGFASMASPLYQLLKKEAPRTFQ
ncbi:unnamed protein product [Heterosigma akashiwo]